MRICPSNFILVMVLALAGQLRGEVDLTFDAGSGLKGHVTALALLPDGKAVICGGFQTVPGASRNSIARILPDGSADLSFDAGEGPNQWPTMLAVQPDGKTIVGGWFTEWQRKPCRGVVRLLENGKVDESFNPFAHPALANWMGIKAVHVDARGRILLSGFAWGERGVGIDGALARLTPDGALDETFQIHSTRNAVAGLIALQPNGSILLGLDSNSGGFAFHKLARLTPDGGLDLTFQGPTISGAYLNSICVQKDGKILFGGDFVKVDDEVRGGLVRVLPDGAFDPTFVHSLAASVKKIAQQEDGLIVVAGNFGLQTGGAARSVITRLQLDGSIDESFRSASPDFMDRFLADFAIQSDKRIVAAGDGNLFFRLKNDGSIDPTFISTSAAGGRIFASVQQGDGKLLVGGYFRFGLFQGQRRPNLARLDANGKIDLLYLPDVPESPQTAIHLLALQQDGRLLVGSSSTDLSQAIWRLDVNGSRDLSFTPPRFERVVGLLATPQNKIIVIEQKSNFSRNYVRRLNASGVADPTFSESNIYSIQAVQPDGKLLVTMPSSDGLELEFSRLDADGSRDPSFVARKGGVSAVAVLPDGKLLLAEFPYVRRLQRDGVEDAAFHKWKAPEVVTQIIPQDGGSFLAIGFHFLARFRPDAALDRLGVVSTDGPLNVLPQADGKLLVTGGFNYIDGVARQFLARLNGIDSMAPLRLEIDKRGDEIFITWPFSSISIQSTAELDTPFVETGDWQGVGRRRIFPNTQEFFRISDP